MRDPYFRPEVCVERLIAEYRTHGKLIVALDFDDTVFDFHSLGNNYDAVIKLVRKAKRFGFYIVLFTGSDPSCYDNQKQYLRMHGIEVEEAVNKNPIPLSFGNHGKMYYNILLDDRAGLGQACAILEAVLDHIGRDYD